MGSLPMFGQFLGSTMSDKKMAKKFSHTNKDGQVQAYMSYVSALGKGAPTPTASAGRLASQTGGRTTRSYQTKGA